MTLITRLVALALAGCGEAKNTVQIVVSAPVSTEPWIASSIEKGARLAVEEINDEGGLAVGLDGEKHPLKLVVLDNASSPAKALANAREAVDAQGGHADHRRDRARPRSPTSPTGRS